MVPFLTKSDASAGFDQIVDFLNAHVIRYALMVNPTIYVSCIKQFWATTSIKKANDVVKLQALIDGKKVVVTEDVIRQNLRLDDADGVECLPNEEIFAELARMGYEKPPPNAKRTTWNEFSCSMTSAIICLATVDDLSSHTTRYTSPALTQKVFANIRRVGKGFSGVETPLFASMLVQPQAAEVEEEVEVPTAPTPPSLTNEPSPPPQDPIPTPSQAQSATPSSPPQEQPTETFASSMTLLNTLLEKYPTLSQKVAQLEQDKITQALEILKLKKRVKKLEKKRRSKSSGLKKLRKVGTSQRVESSTETVVGAQENASKQIGKIAEIDADEDIILYQDLKKKPVSVAQAMKNMIIYLKNIAGYKMKHFRVEVSGSDSTQETPTNDPKEMSEEDVQNMLEIIPVVEFKVEALQVKYPLIDWEIHSEGSRSYWKLLELVESQKHTRVLKTCSRDLIEKIWILCGDWLKKKKDYPLSNGVVTLMLSTKLQVEEDNEMARDHVMKILMKANQPKSKSLDTSSKWRETSLKNAMTVNTRSMTILPKYEDKEENIDWNAITEQVQERYQDNVRKYQDLKKKLVSVAQARKNMIIYLKNIAGYKMKHFRGMTYDKIIPEIIRVGGITEAYQSFEDMLKGFDREDLDTLWRLVKEKFSSAVPNKLHSKCGVHQVSSTTRRHDIFMLTEKDYPLSNGVVTLMLSTKLQVEEDSEMARDPVVKILMKANQPKSKSLDTSSK
nr:hypothetical protein [Tanacetum cinerariifolium]